MFGIDEMDSGFINVYTGIDFSSTDPSLTINIFKYNKETNSKEEASLDHNVFRFLYNSSARLGILLSIVKIQAKSKKFLSVQQQEKTLVLRWVKLNVVQTFAHTNSEMPTNFVITAKKCKEFSYQTINAVAFHILPQSFNEILLPNRNKFLSSTYQHEEDFIFEASDIKLLINKCPEHLAYCAFVKKFIETKKSANWLKELIDIKTDEDKKKVLRNFSLVDLGMDAIEIDKKIIKLNEEQLQKKFELIIGSKCLNNWVKHHFPQQIPTEYLSEFIRHPNFRQIIIVALREITTKYSSFYVEEFIAFIIGKLLKIYHQFHFLTFATKEELNLLQENLKAPKGDSGFNNNQRIFLHLCMISRLIDKIQKNIALSKQNLKCARTLDNLLWLIPEELLF